MTEPIQATKSVSASSPMRRRIGKCAAYLCAVIAVYVASIGPMYGLTGFQLNGMDSASDGQKVCEVAYRPIYWACRKSTSARNTVSTYLGLWSHR